MLANYKKVFKKIMFEITRSFKDLNINITFKVA